MSCRGNHPLHSHVQYVSGYRRQFSLMGAISGKEWRVPWYVNGHLLPCGYSEGTHYLKLKKTYGNTATLQLNLVNHYFLN